jgi:hypothetical protein
VLRDADDPSRPFGFPPGTSMFEFFPRGGAKIGAELWWDGAARRMVGLCYFSAHAEGPPGRVHGGATATAFDGMLGGVVIRSVGLGTNTTSLTVAYLRALPIGAVVRFEGAVLPPPPTGNAEEGADAAAASTSVAAAHSAWGTPARHPSAAPAIVATGQFRGLADAGVVYATAASEWRRPRHMAGVDYEDSMRQFGRLSGKSEGELRADFALVMAERAAAAATSEARGRKAHL